ncbi:MAG TPA: hypothetical protein VII16_06405 [Actinomycetes bacterium]
MIVPAAPDEHHHQPGAVCLACRRTRRIAGVSLDERRRRLLRDLDLTPTVPTPCTGCCRCYGAPMGSGCGS